MTIMDTFLNGLIGGLYYAVATFFFIIFLVALFVFTAAISGLISGTIHRKFKRR